MSELVWIHRFNANELGLGSRGSFCLVPVDARIIFFPSENYQVLDSGAQTFEVYLSDIGQYFNVGYTKPPSKTEHRLSLSGGITQYIGQDGSGSLIEPGKIGCFYRKDGTICLTVADLGSAYDCLLNDFPTRNRVNNLTTETVFQSSVGNNVSEPEVGYKVDSIENNEAFNVEEPGTNIIYYGAPGTGKSYTVKEKLKDVPKNNVETVTFHPDYDYASFVGGYKPISELDNEGKDTIKYKFVPQVFTNIYVKAWKNQDQHFYLVVEEINRGNCAEIFGDIFQLLDRDQNYTITPSQELKTHLIQELSETHSGVVHGLKMPKNLSILATMNTSDQSLFPMDSAFKRRWDWEYMPIDYELSNNNPSSKFRVYINDKEYFLWIDFIKSINYQIKSNPNLGMDKCIVNYFIKPKDNNISLKTFINKAIFYLWNDVFKDEFGDESIFSEGITYERFFPINTNGESEVINMLESLEITIYKEVD